MARAEFKRETIFRRAYDLRGGNPNYGQHCMEMLFVLSKGAKKVMLAMQTDWGLPSQRYGGYYAGWLRRPEGIWWEATKGKNDKNPNVSYLYSREWTEGFIAGGSPWLWEKLEESWRNVFADGPRPDLTPKPMTQEEVRPLP